MEDNNLMQVQNLSKTFMVRKGFFKKTYIEAVQNVSFALQTGEILALTGESGSGKTTVGRILLKLTEPTCGEVLYRGVPLKDLKGDGLKSYRKAVQSVFQDPHSSLNPRMTVFDIIAEPLKNFAFKDGLSDRITSLMEEVGLGEAFAGCFPHQLSGGQKQRVAIARALALNPEVVVMDEPLSALDITVQTQILSLIKDLKLRYNISFILITHDMRVVRAVADRVAVMYKGELLEIADRETFVTNPEHPYSKSLIEAMPVI